MAAPPPSQQVFNPLTVANSFTTIGNHLAGLQNESNTLTQEFAVRGNAPPVALAQLQQTCNQILSKLLELRAEGHNNRARLSNLRVSTLDDPIAPLHSATTNAPVQNFPATLQALRALTIVQLRGILNDLRIVWQNNISAPDLRNLLRIEIGCGQA